MRRSSYCLRRLMEYVAVAPTWWLLTVTEAAEKTKGEAKGKRRSKASRKRRVDMSFGCTGLPGFVILL